MNGIILYKIHACSCVLFMYVQLTSFCRLRQILSQQARHGNGFRSEWALYATRLLERSPSRVREEKSAASRNARGPARSWQVVGASPISNVDGVATLAHRARTPRRTARLYPYNSWSFQAWYQLRNPCERVGSDKRMSPWWYGLPNTHVCLWTH